LLRACLTNGAGDEREEAFFSLTKKNFQSQNIDYVRDNYKNE
jgi:hypothetical protein